MDRVKIGLIGCGNISGNYLKNAKTFPILDVVACSDIDVPRAQARAKEHGVPRGCSPAELLADPRVEIVVNLTVPAVHAEVALQAIEAGKHVVSEKPLGINRVEAEKVIQAAKRRGVRVGCAPDTFLGAGHQTARKLIDDGAIGRPVAATAFMMSRGVEAWHPNPEFYYKPGGGPMFDMGPYYLTDLMQLIGPVRRVSGFTSIAIPDRVIGSEPFKGQKIKVETPDHIAGTIDFANGAVLLMKRGENEFKEVPLTHRTGYGRSVGVADLAYAIRSGRPHRASGENAWAVVDAMEGFLDAGRTGNAYTLKAPYTRPAALPAGLKEGVLDA
jgi:predicted dehydrogenase